MLNSGSVKNYSNKFRRLALMAVALNVYVTTFCPQAFSVTTEQRFQDLFTTAGYATAFGAALGAAALSFKNRPENHLRYVAIGASMGFIGGSILGTYVIFAPVATASKIPMPSGYAGVGQWGIHPTYNTITKQVEGIYGTTTLAEF